MVLTTVAGAVAIKGVGLVGLGFCMALGFWCGKKLTNKIDYFLYVHSKDYREEQKNAKPKSTD